MAEIVKIERAKPTITSIQRVASAEDITPRGVNAGGVLRNVAAGAIPFADELEAAARSGQAFEGADYEKYLQNARESRRAFSEAYPGWAVTSQFAGALLPALATRGKIIGNLPNTARGKALRGGISGALIGGLYGFGEGEGGLENRLNTMAQGATVGGALGTLFPAAGTMLGRIFSKPLTEQQISNAILDTAIKPGYKSANIAETYANAARLGATDIQNAAKNLDLKMRSMSQWERNPYGVESTINAPWTSETPSAQRILEAVKSPSAEAAEVSYANWISGIKPNNQAGLAISNLAREEPNFNKLLTKELSENAEDWINQPYTSFEGLKRLTNLAQRETKSVTPISTKAKAEPSVTQRSWERISKKLEDLREKLYPGQREQDLIYRAGQLQQTEANKTALDRVRQIAQETVQSNPEISTTGAARIAFKPWARGVAREMMLNQGNLVGVKPQTMKVLNSLADALNRSIQGQQNIELSNPENYIDVQFGNQTMTDDPNVWYNKPVRY